MNTPDEALDRLDEMLRTAIARDLARGGPMFGPEMHDRLAVLAGHDYVTVPSYPDPGDGPQKRGWTPVMAGHAGAARRDTARRAFKLLLIDESGAKYRFLLTREHMAWIVWAVVGQMTPWLAGPARWWYCRQRRMQRQSERSSGTPSRDGSPQEGQPE